MSNPSVGSPSSRKTVALTFSVALHVAVIVNFLPKTFSARLPEVSRPVIFATLVQEAVVATKTPEVAFPLTPPEPASGQQPAEPAKLPEAAPEPERRPMAPSSPIVVEPSAAAMPVAPAPDASSTPTPPPAPRRPVSFIPAPPIEEPPAPTPPVPEECTNPPGTVLKAGNSEISAASCTSSPAQTNV
ncbi:hypothetical protein Q9L58_010860, partial [Maublancomyces gigas]